MGTMNKMRENTGVILWILVFAFGVIWVLQDSGGLDVLPGAGSQNIITVDGDPVTYDEYNRALEQQIEAYQQQTGESMPPQRMDLEKERVFNALVENKLREHEMDRLGITVTDDEVYDLVLGDNPHPIIKVYFGDGQGGVDRDLLQSFVNDPEAREQWIQLEDYLRQERRRQKLDNLIAATVRVSDADVMQEYRKRNVKAEAKYVSLRYADVPDDSVQVTESDIKSFYNSHKDEFERNRSYTLKVATLSKLPSAEDTTASVEDVARLKPTFAEAADDSSFLARYGSERPYTSAFFARGDLAPELADAVFQDPEPGKIVGPVIAGDEIHLAKIMEVRPAEETSVKAQHILFQAPEGATAARQSARQQAEEVKQKLQDGADFATMARQYSDDPGSASRGGDLGWFGPGTMVEAFENAAFDAPVGKVIGPIETQFGYHLIKVNERAQNEVRLADYAQKLRASTGTLSDAEERLGDLQYYAEEQGNFDQEAQRLGINVQEVQVEKDQQFIPGIGNSRSLMTFLEDAEEGDISKVIELDDQFIVASVASVTPEGYRSLDEVRSELEPRTRLDKKRQIQERRMEQALKEHGFDGLASALPNAVQRTANNVSFNNLMVTGLGRDAAFAGTVLGMKEGEVSGVVEGQNGVFVAKTIKIVEPSPITDAEREQIRNELLNRRRSQVQQEWLASLRESADVEDNRARFQQ